MQLIRILIIAIVGVLGLDVEGMHPQAPVQTVFDLPADTPGLMRDKQVKKVCDKLKDCVHVIVPGTNAHYAKDRGIIESMAVDGNIYFPADGTQPTTKEAVEYSCANIDNTESSPITDWYMKMFGVIDKDGGNSVSDDDYVKAGGDAFSTSSYQIIMFDVSVDDTPVVDPDTPNIQISRKDLFKREFRKIACNPVGRVLLYRILIEIRRVFVDDRGNNIGFCENNAQIKSIQIAKTLPVESSPIFFGANVRNSVRNLKILWDQNDCSFTANYPGMEDSGVLRFSATNIQKQVVIGKLPYCGGGLVQLRQSILTDDLFHEFIHWYHILRDTLRASNDLNSRGSDKLYEGIGSVYYSWARIAPDLKRKLASVSWSCYYEDTNIISVNFEEMRTILGVDAYYPEYLEGDDISENLFALSRSCMTGSELCGIRFGHKDFPYVEHIYSVDREIKTLEAINNYGITTRYTLPDIPQLMPNAFDLNGVAATQYSKKIEHIAECITP